MIVDVQTTGHVTTLRMNDPGRRNVLGPEMLTELIAAFDRLTSETRAIILRAGPEDVVWCSGFDIKSLKPEFDPLAGDGQLQRLVRPYLGFSRAGDRHDPWISMGRWHRPGVPV